MKERAHNTRMQTNQRTNVRRDRLTTTTTTTTTTKSATETEKKKQIEDVRDKKNGLRAKPRLATAKCQLKAGISSCVD
ncbi:hypothetical protein RUM44_002723 [Polyplax serrata]|uniref:Uncharacterized protein n=1 Tax=Polyplax serrata TaxID=468196 RepID=A0ABR1AFI6_POLSC